VHGWSGDQSYWRNQVPEFSLQNRVVTLDLAGHGESGLGRKDWTVGAFAEDVATVVKGLSLERVILIGHSMGGPVTLEAALRCREELVGLIGVDTFFDRWVHPSAEQKGRLESFFEDFEGTTRQWVRQHLFLPSSDPALVEEVSNDMASAPPEVGAPAMKRIYEWGQADFVAALQKLDSPFCIVQAAVNMNSLETVFGFASSFPFFQVTSLPGVGHFAMLEDPEGFNRLLAQAVAHLQNYSPSSR